MRPGDEVSTSRRGEGRILAVDDTPANLTALSALLEPMGHEVVTADSGPKALACAAEGEFALVLLDVMMPGMDGFETLRRLSDLPGFKGTPVILLTAYEPQPRLIEHAYEVGAADYVFKPIAPAVLRAKVEVFISLYRRGMELGRRRDALLAKDRQISILAHDLRSPLSAITMVAGSMARADASAAIREKAERILRAAGRMDKMTRDLLDFARIGAGGLPIDRAAADLAAVVRDTVDEIRTAHVGHSIELDLADRLAGSWDRDRLQQAVSNLVINAINYGGGRIAVRGSRVGARVELSVWNDGEPISTTRIGRIFEPFERGQLGGAGLGLGLYVVSEIARAHGGSVSVSSSREVGTIFTLSLPVEPERDGAVDGRI